MKTPGQVAYEAFWEGNTPLNWETLSGTVKHSWEISAAESVRYGQLRAVLKNPNRYMPRTATECCQVPGTGACRTATEARSVLESNYQTCREENGHLRRALHQICVRFFHNGPDGPCASDMLCIAESALATLVPEGA